MSSAVMKAFQDQFTDFDTSKGTIRFSTAGTQLPPHLRSVGEYTKSLRQLFEQALARRLRKGVSDGDLPPGTNVKELAAYFDTIFRGRADHARDAHRANEFLRPAGWQFERGVQDLLTRILTTVQEGRDDKDE